MNKTKLLSIAVILLLIANLVLAGFMYFGRHQRPDGTGPRNIIIQKLNFDESQVKEYDKLIEEHRTEIRKSEQEIKDLKNKLYTTLINESENNSKDSLINELSKVQLKIENIHYKHFEDIKKLCNKEQQQAFENFTREIVTLFSPGPPKGPGLPKDKN